MVGKKPQSKTRVAASKEEEKVQTKKIDSARAKSKEVPVVVPKGRSSRS